MKRKNYSLQIFIVRAFVVLALSVFSPSVFAQQVQERFHDWSLFKAKRGLAGQERDFCYIMSLPIDRIGNEDRKGESYFMVTNIENDADEISVSSGFFYDESSDVELSFYTKKFYLFPHKLIAWADDVNDDLEIIKQMQRENDMTVVSISREGYTATDRYSLIGFSQAYKKMQDVCHGLGVKSAKVKSKKN